MKAKKKITKGPYKQAPKFRAMDLRAQSDKFETLINLVEKVEQQANAIFDSIGGTEYDGELAEIVRTADALTDALEDAGMCLEVEADDIDEEAI